MKRNIKKIIASMLTSAMALGGANIAFAVNLPALMSQRVIQDTKRRTQSL